MFFLSKKRIMVLGIFLLAVLAIGISQIFIEPETVETVALPVSNKVICNRRRTWGARWTGLLAKMEYQKLKSI